MSTSIAKAVAALVNTYGGLVLVAVTDDRRVTGVKEGVLPEIGQVLSLDQ
ncbi:hypothetical protein [Actinomadura citrea]